MPKQFKVIPLGMVLLAGGLGGYSFSDPLSPSKNPSDTLVSQNSNSSSLRDLEVSVELKINQHRQSQGLSSLRSDQRISDQARAHSEAMAKGQVPLGHDGFEQRVKSTGILYTKVAENVAVNQGHSDPATQAVQSWLKSSGHRQNIEGSYDLTGVGVAKNSAGEYYFTQIFIKER